MSKSSGGAVFVVLFLIFGVCSADEAVGEQSGDWSEVNSFLKARLCLKNRTVLDNHSEILVYIELCNNCPPEGTVHVTFPFSSVSNLLFIVKDSEGNEIKSQPVFCSTRYDSKPFELTLPQDCMMRFCISQNGGGVREDMTLLYLVPGQGWYFRRGEGKTYELTATLSIVQSERFETRHWAGELKLPPVRIPVPEIGTCKPVETEEKAKN